MSGGGEVATRPQERFHVYENAAATAPATAAPTALTAGTWQAWMNQFLGLYGEPPVAQAPLQPPGDQPRQLKDNHALKADDFPGRSREVIDPVTKKPVPPVEGAPNYRELAGENIHGVAQPTIQGIRNVLDKTGARKDGDNKPAVWANLREEPVLYIQGKPYNLRHMTDQAWKFNESAPGRTAAQVDRIEQEIKQDLLDQIKAGKPITVYDEKDGKPVPVQVKLKPEDVKTTEEVFTELKKDYNVDYKRVPITDQRRPEHSDLDELTAHFSQAPKDAAIIVNCHAGQGRTTTAMVVASMVRHVQEHPQHDKEITSKNRAVREDIKETGERDTGNYRMILGLMKALEKGPESKAEADAIIDRSSALVNLRDEVGSARRKADAETDPAERQSKQDVAKGFLDRYFTIITYDAYAHEQGPKGFPVSYSEWRKSKPELDALQQRIELASGLRAQPENRVA